jgi:hypothetical protein
MRDGGLAGIDREVARIDKLLPGMSSIRLDLTDSQYYAAGSEAIAFVQDGSIVRIDVSSSGDLGSVRERFYFSANFLVLFQERKSISEVRGNQEASPRSMGIYFSQGAVLGMIDYDAGKRKKKSVSLATRGIFVLEKAGYLLNLALQK